MWHAPICTRPATPLAPTKIPVAGPGVQITCEHGRQIAGGSGSLQWQHNLLPGLLPAGWTDAVSEVGTFTTSTTSTFSQNVTVDVSWRTTDSGLPIGEYSGFVKLIGMVRP